MKKCNTCDIIKTELEFHKRGEGLQAKCKKCKHEFYKEKNKDRKPNRGKDIERLNKGLKVCFCCKKEKTLDNYNKQPAKSSVDGYHPYCRDCRKEKREKDYKDNLAHYRIVGVKNSSARRARKKLLDTGLVTTQFLKELYREETCHYCQEHIQRDQRTIDHVIPIFKNGLHDPSNLVMCCYYCNRSKGSKDKDVFLKLL